MNNFSNLKINNDLLKSLEKLNILEPTPIQEKSIPLLLEGNDVIGQAQTGTGKTFSYAIPLIQKLDIKSNFIESLVILPTRELSIQVSNEIKKLITDNKKIRLATIYGGQSYELQFKQLNKMPQIVIGTPGRIIDLMEKGKLSFKNVKYLVLDEADEMLKMGFQDDLEKILYEMPKARQTALFSATIPPFIKSIVKKYMNDPKLVSIESKTLSATNIDEKIYYCMRDSKKDLLIRLIDYNQFNSIMIFTNTKAMVDELVVFLQKNGYKADGIHGDLKQNSRDRVMNSFRDSNLDILVATDVAARGIDIEGIECVINYDVPNENELYVHRIGRTARAGLSGVALTIATSKSKGKIEEIEKYTKRKIKEDKIPDINDIDLVLKKKLYHKILDNLNSLNYKHDYDEIIYKLAKISTDPMPILNTLISMLDENKKTYPEILVKKYNNKDNKKFNKDSKKTKKDNIKSNEFVIIELNKGKDLKLKPSMLVNFFHDELKIHREHFGKIIVEDNKTYIEIKKEALRFLTSLKNKKINNQKISYKEIKKMPK